MGNFDKLRASYQWGYWFDTPQGICVLLSIPVCALAALAAVIWPTETKPTFLLEGPVLFLFSPLVAFVYFIRYGQFQRQQFSSSVFATLVILAVVATPFCLPYLRDKG
jgi:hypothetical protein